MVTGIAGGEADKLLFGIHSKASIDTHGTLYKHENAGSSAANRIHVPTNTTFLASELGAAVMIYDAVQQRWKIA